MAKSKITTFPALDNMTTILTNANDKWLKIIDQENLSNWSKYLDSFVDTQLSFMDKTYGNIQKQLDPLFLKMPSNFEKIVKANIAATEGKMSKGVFNSTYGDFKDKNANWNNAPKATLDGIMSMIPIVGDIWNVGDNIGTLLHNRGQIADDVYREEINKLLSAQYQLEGTVLNGKGSYNDKLLATLNMRANFWDEALKAFKWDKGNKYYEADVREFNKVLFDISQVKAKIADPSQNGFSNFGNRPEDLLKQKLQNYRDIYLMSDRTNADYEEYKKNVLASTDKITKNQKELFHVKADYYKLLDYDLKEIGKAQSEPREALSRLINNYNKGAGSITKENFISKLKDIIAAGKLSSDPEVQDVGDAAERQIYFVEQAEKTKADKIAYAAEIEADRKAKENYNALKAHSDLAIKEKSLEEESLKKHLDLNNLKAQADKNLISYRIKDEKAKEDLLRDIERQRLEAAAVLEYEYAQKHSALYAGMQSGFGTMWNEFIVGSRKAKNSWDAVWLSMRNTALNKIGSEVSDSFMKMLFKGSSNSGAGGDKNDAGLLDTIISYAMYAIPFLADGAIVTKPTLAMIGEAGPEGVIPLDQMNSTKVIYVQPVIQGNFDVSLHKLQMKLDQNKQMMEALY